MFFFRRTALWSSCAILAAGYVAGEELVARRSVPPALAVVAFSPPAESASVQSGEVADFAPPVIDAADVFGTVPGRAWRATGAASPTVVSRKPTKLRRVQRVTAYCDRGTTAAGVESGVGQCAAPVDIPFGSTVHVPALGRTFIVTDRTDPRFQHNTVDIFIPSEAQCRKFGRRYTACEFTIAEHPPAYGKVRIPRRHD